MKRALHQGGDNALNIYPTTAGPYLGWAYCPTIVKHGQRLPGRHRHRLGVDARRVDALRGPLRPGRDRDARGRPLARPRAHVPGRLQRKGDYVDDTPAELTPTSGLPGRQGHVPGAGPRPDPQLHGLLVRLLLHGVHARPDPAHAGRVALLPRSVAATLIERRARARAGPLVPALDWTPRACSSGDRARASGARGRRFDSCQAHTPLLTRNREGWQERFTFLALLQHLAHVSATCSMSQSTYMFAVVEIEEWPTSFWTAFNVYRASVAGVSPTSSAGRPRRNARRSQVSSPKTSAPLPPKTANCSLTFVVIT